MNDITNLADTIKPKSDQLNADDLLTGPITVTINDVSRGTADQPVFLALDGLMPYKPCKTMRRVLVTAWGINGKDWIGRSLTLYCDPSVKFGGVALGGIRISHLSHINGSINMMLTASRGRKSQFIVQQLVQMDYTKIIEEYELVMKDETAKTKLWATLSPDKKAAIRLALEGKGENK
tara:strand:- start:3454 stop:3987 length:534 start_codon:yes stop_codon:yes gene_type:complete